MNEMEWLLLLLLLLVFPPILTFEPILVSDRGSVSSCLRSVPVSFSDQKSARPMYMINVVSDRAAVATDDVKSPMGRRLLRTDLRSDRIGSDQIGSDQMCSG